MRFLSLLTVFVLCLYAAPSQAQTVIRDEEIERDLKTLSAPLIRAAGLDEDTVRFILIEDPAVNAFVMGGQNVFLHTGLILETRNAEELAAVIAHELGHIAASHLARGAQAADSSSAQAILGLLLGGAVALASGDGSALIAGAEAGRWSMIQNMLGHTRTIEWSADQAGIRFLREAGYPLKGAADFMQRLSLREGYGTMPVEGYWRTHPYMRERAETLTHDLLTTPDKGTSIPDAAQLGYRMSRAKLIGYLEPQALDYDIQLQSDETAKAYAMAIAAYRRGDITKALATSRKLLEDISPPRSAYLHELIGQILFEDGQADKAVDSYKQAVQIVPDSGLLRLALSHALIERGHKGDYNEALGHLKLAGQLEPRLARRWQLLAIVYGRLGMNTDARLAQAELALSRGNIASARQLAEQIRSSDSASQTQKRRAKDILSALD